jgi:long-chain acyl-CoA synthetase
VFPDVHARSAPDRAAIAMADTGEQRTWAEVEARSAALATWLRHAGLTTGDVVMLALPNDVRWAEIAWACWRTGLVLAPVNVHLGTGELRALVDVARPAAAIVDAGLAAGIGEALRAGPGSAAVLTVGLDYDDAVERTTPDPDLPETMGGRLMFSSGTTGRPKAYREEPPGLHPADVPLRYRPMMEDLGMVPGPGEPAPVMYSPGPAHHTAPMGFMHAVHQLGGTVVTARRFDAERSLAGIERYRVTHSLWVPTMFVRLLRLPDEVRTRYDLRSHRVAVHGAAPCPPVVKQAMLDWWGPILGEYYGSSEGYGRTAIGPHEWLAHPGSVGRAKGGSIRITDDAGRDLAVGGTGRVWLVRPDAPEPVRAADGGADLASLRGWGWAGDVGHVDAEGYLYLTGRESQIIVTGGVNVHPREIEDLLALHPDVADVAVLGVPDDEFGEQVRAAVAPLGAPRAGLAEELVDHCRAHLAHYKCPRGVDLVDRVPRNSAGKILLDELRRTLR